MNKVNVTAAHAKVGVTLCTNINLRFLNAKYYYHPQINWTDL